MDVKKASGSGDNKIPKSFKFTIACGGGDGAYLCIQPVTKMIYEYFEANDLDLEKYALDDSYAEEKKIPENMQPFEPGCRASFGSYECGMTATNHLELFVENEDSGRVFSGMIPKSNIKLDKQACESLANKEKGIYAVGYEGLEDCYVSGVLELDSNFDVKKFKVYYGYLDYQLGDRNLISSITYDKDEVEWEVDSYEGTGDNGFGFVVVD